MEASPPPQKSRPAPAESETILESLPSEVHERIVSFLPIRDAVRTSAVARAWRRIWVSAPGLAHDWGNEYGADPAHADAVLARYTRPVRSFFFCLRAVVLGRGRVPASACRQGRRRRPGPAKEGPEPCPGMPEPGEIGS
ncbi:unnamed protein product [Urochloa humidicola]